MDPDVSFATADPCGQNLLALVSRGNAIIAELLRLRDYLPDVFRKDKKEEWKKYAPVIFDFSYFKIADAVEAKIEADDNLRKLDAQFRENYLEVVSRFYVAYESIYKYITDLNNFIRDLSDGVYFQHSMENVFADPDGKQLMCEALYLLGAQLLTAEQIEGDSRERLLVAHHRGSLRRSAHCHLDDVCKLLRSTGRVEGGRRPPNYPEHYFSRVPVAAEYAALVVDQLRSGDIYCQAGTYPLPEHRATALAPQAAMLYVCLYFRPAVLAAETAVMREIVDKFFPDNWVISVYMGSVVNLLEAWEPYKAARTVLQASLDTAAVRQMASKHAAKMEELTVETGRWLQEGSLTPDLVLGSWHKLIALIRQCNVTLRWVLLHTSQLPPGHELKRGRQYRELAVAEGKFEPDTVFRLLLHSCQLELRCRQLLKQLLADRENLWRHEQELVVSGLKQLSAVFSGSQTLTKLPKNERLEKWFVDLCDQVSALSLSQSPSDSRRLLQVMKALNDVQAFHRLESDAAVSQHLSELRQSLRRMVLLAALRDDMLATLSVVTDFSYAWLLVDKLTDSMQRSIRHQPALVAKLRAVFLKLCSALDLPLLRINQARSEDLASVSQHYSAELVTYLRRVIQIIPQTMFGLLDQIIEIQTNELKETPTRLDKDKMKEHAQLDQRFEMARLTHAVSVLTDGILAMKTTLVGVIRLDPAQLLEDGIRKQLVQLMAETLHNTLTFGAKHKPSELPARLEELARRMDGFRRSFEYIQDYVHLYGLRVWQEELTRIVNLNVEQECNSFLQIGVHERDSVYQSRTVPVPLFPPTDKARTFVGRLAAQLLLLTDPRSTVYIRPLMAWYCLRSHQQVADRRLPGLLAAGLGVAGLAGVDRLLAFFAVTTLQSIMTLIGAHIGKDKTCVEALSALEASLQPHGGPVGNPSKVYGPAVARLQRPLATLLEHVTRLGQLTLLRESVAAHLASAASFDSRHLASALAALNTAVLTEHDVTSDSLTPLVSDLTPYLDWAGLSDPLSRVYLMAEPPPRVATVLLLFLLAHAPKLTYVKSLGGLSCVKASEPLDAAPLVSGLAVLLGQLPDADEE
ncbi:WASH complex subunit 5-like [Pollicipes pollicipes]|uniref:WASH complex subunit 5-like n=1 Tax=Pollicipes pollicipes TaxID=41117 RepID=UPI001884AC94|nr:WASH complex subunit 5-like [Pollicipes pollicipes]